MCVWLQSHSTSAFRVLLGKLRPQGHTQPVRVGYEVAQQVTHSNPQE